MSSVARKHMPQPTGDMLVLFEPGTKPKAVDRLISKVAGSKTAHSADFKTFGAAVELAFEEASVLTLDHLGIAVMKAPPEASVATTTLRAAPEVMEVRPEFWMHALDDWEERRTAWIREGLSLLMDRGAPVRAPGALPAAMESELSATWGLAATRADRSKYTGAGIKVAVLDTGLDLHHPDFLGRVVVSESFVPGESVQDMQGHGTHCIGTACGPVAPPSQIRYGVAYEADIHVGKVLNNLGSGRESWILAGIDWAVNGGCEIISMSLGREVQVGEPPDPFYERAGSYALENGSLIIAAAGNNSWRQYNSISPVASPANARSIMAVAAIDAKMKVANFSCGGLNPNGGEVDIAAPGVDILSSFPLPRAYERLSGTSMATPHVAGIAALLAQSDASLRGKQLWEALTRSAISLGHPARDTGAGLVIAP